MTSAGLDQRVAYAPRAVTRAAVRGGDSALGNLVARAMRVATGADLAVINTTGIRDDLPAGELTVEDVFRVLPFDDRLVTERIKGAALLDAVERIRSASCDRDGESQAQIDGATLRLGCARGQESEVRVGGRAVDPGATYLIATVSFLTQAGRWLEPPTGVTVEDVGVVRDAVLGAIRSLPPCAADAGSPLPCLDARAGAGTDGRIEWQ
jgi:2',3'-cyclic-nucleotide 2'-phosphodiesterase (5'-nucleotidase family)